MAESLQTNANTRSVCFFWTEIITNAKTTNVFIELKIELTTDILVCLMSDEESNDK